MEEQTEAAGMRAFTEFSLRLGRVSGALKSCCVPPIALSTNNLLPLQELPSEWRWTHSVIVLRGSSTQNCFASVSCASGAQLSLLPITVSHFQWQITAGRLKSVSCVLKAVGCFCLQKQTRKKNDTWLKHSLIRNNSCVWGSRIWFLSFFSHNMQWIVSALTLSSHTSKI